MTPHGPFQIAARLTAEKIANASLEMSRGSGGANGRNPLSLLDPDGAATLHISLAVRAVSQHVLDFTKRNFRSGRERLALGQSGQTLSDPFGMILCEFLGLAQADALRHGQDNIPRRRPDAQSQASRGRDAFERDPKNCAIMRDFDFLDRRFWRSDEKIQHAIEADRSFGQRPLPSITFGISGRKKSNAHFEPAL